MDNNHDAWAHLRDMCEDLGADYTLTDGIRKKVLDVYDRIDGGVITALNERDAQIVVEALLQSVRNTKSRSR